MLVFATANGVPALLAGRVLQGLSTGAAVGALGAGMLDLNRSKGTIANAVGPLTGTASGALGSSLLIQYLPDPTRLVYLVLLAAFVVQAVGVALMPETSATRHGALASLRPRFGLPADVRGPVLMAAPVLVAAWSLAGFYGSIGPATIRTISGSDSLLLGGLALFILAGSGALSVLALRSATARSMMLLGTIALLVGAAITLLAISLHSELVFLAGTAIAGIGFGSGFQGAIRTVVPLAAADERAGVLSVIFLISYLSMGLPAVIAGYLVVHSGGLMTTAREYAVAVMALAAVALVGLATRRRHPAAARPDAPLRCTSVLAPRTAAGGRAAR